MNDKPLYAYFGHHKCATQYIIAVVHNVCAYLGRKFVKVNNDREFDGDLARFVETNRVDFLAYANAVNRYVEPLDRMKGFHVIRDPRDIVVSAYFSHLHSHPVGGWTELKKHREELENATKEEGIYLVMKHSDHEFKSLYDWAYDRPHILELRMEDMIRNPYDVFARIFLFLGLSDDARYSLPKRAVSLACEAVNAVYYKSRGIVPIRIRRNRIAIPTLFEIVYAERFSAKTKGRQQGQEDVKSHYRKGVAGDWRNHFTDDHIAYFKQHYNDLLLKLGYESTPDW